MTCNDFRKKVTDLFDKHVDPHTRAECMEHMKKCAECKTYYDELNETYRTLQPKKNARLTETKRHNKAWRLVEQ